MASLADLRPGDIMFAPMPGFVPGIFPVGAGMVLLAERKARLSWRDWWRYRHVAVVTEALHDEPPSEEWPTGVINKGSIVQAMPHGAEEVPLMLKHWTPDHLYIRPAYRDPASLLNLPYKEAEWGFEVAEAARRYVGTPYNFLTYGKLAAGALGLPAPLLRKWISTRRDMMCSQLADQALADAGWHVFDDGRLPQDVVPAELLRQMLVMPGQHLIPEHSASGWIPNRVPWQSEEKR